MFLFDGHGVNPLAIINFRPAFVVVLHGRHRRPVKSCVGYLGTSFHLPSFGPTCFPHKLHFPGCMFRIHQLLVDKEVEGGEGKWDNKDEEV